MSILGYSKTVSSSFQDRFLQSVQDAFLTQRKSVNIYWTLFVAHLSKKKAFRIRAHAQQKILSFDFFSVNGSLAWSPRSDSDMTHKERSCLNGKPKQINIYPVYCIRNLSI